MKWHHRVWLVKKNKPWITDYLGTCVYASTIYGAKIQAQRDHPGYKVTHVDGKQVL